MEYRHELKFLVSDRGGNHQIPFKAADAAGQSSAGRKLPCQESVF